jgi:release factor glutamine methyltransferase
VIDDVARLKEAAARLAAAGIDEPMREARILAKEASDAATFDAFITRRAKREPVAYILGRREFWSLELEVTPAVLIPRPDTETLVETALAELRHNPPARFLDLGTGSGAILIALLKEWPRATAIGIDKSPAALLVARNNALRHRVADRAELRHGDWAQDIAERFDLVISNPPYISDDEFVQLDPDVRAYEPAEALLAGPTGLADIERIAEALPALLMPQAPAIVEIGYKQAQSASDLFTKSGLEIVKIAKDLAGRDRAVVARLPQLTGR